ncbi:acetyltransferase [Paenibacillus glycanilyticus]|uniref:Acetyltransferase EpsM n=2 Tax=Paenibacillus TaxID=44249 RepID=A0ABQ6NT68_9BACL|nr:acetyltransferase [Paenibacillus glycanilyticus]GMK48305.1 putative acetyltransferase EpsM [Paenibacillus glycanilyticus]
MISGHTEQYRVMEEPARRPLIVVGMGGHGRVLMDIARVSKTYRLAAVLDDRFSGVELRGGLPYGPIATLKHFLADEPGMHVVIGIGDNRTRRAIVEMLSLPESSYAVLVHPAAVVAEDARIGLGAVVMPGAVIGPGAVVGAHAIINSGAVVEHDALVGPFAHVSPNATMAGAASAEEGAHIGSGAVLIPRIRVGSWSVLGAGGVAVRDIPGGKTAVGVPARVVQPRLSVEKAL